MIWCLLFFSIVLGSFSQNNFFLWLAIGGLALWIGFLRDEIDNVQTSLKDLQQYIDGKNLPIVKTKAQKITEIIQEEKPEPSPYVPTPKIMQATSQPRPTVNIKRETASVSQSNKTIINRKFTAQSLIVWFAGFATILGAFYLVKYMVAHGILTPAFRLSLLTIAGIAAVIGGKWLYHQENFADHKRISQVLIGSGFSALYFAAYALSKLYFFAPEIVSFVLMCIVTALAIVVTLTIGEKAIAFLTLLGVFLTPMLVTGLNHNSLFFSSYMLIVFGAFFFVATALKSLLLIIITLAGIYGWELGRLLLFDLYAFDSVVLMFLMVGISAITHAFSKRFYPSHSLGLNISTLLLCFTFGLLSLIKAKFGILEWGICGLMLLISVSLAIIRPKIYMPILWTAALTILGMFVLSIYFSYPPLWLYSCIAAIALLPCYGVLVRQFSNIPVAVYTAIMTPAYYLCAYFLYRESVFMPYAGIITGFCLLLLCYKKDLIDVKFQMVAGVLLLSAMALITVGFCMIVDIDSFVSLTVIEILVFCVVKTYTRALFTDFGIYALLMWLMCLVINQMIITVGILSPLQLGPITFVREHLTPYAFISYGLLPSICFGISYFISNDKNLRLLMQILTSVFVSGLLFMLIIVFKMQLFEMSTYHINIKDYAFITDILLLLTFYLKEHDNNWYKGIYILALSRVVIMCFMIFGSIYHSNELGSLSTILVLGVPLVLIMRLAYSRKILKLPAIYIGAACSFALVTALLNIQLNGMPCFRFYNINDTMLFSYSVCWFLLGVCWLIIAFYFAPMIKIAFGMIYFVIAKVFLYDVAALNDFWRIVSLFALAGALLAVSHFYTKKFSSKI